MIQRSNPPKGGAGRARILDSSDPLVSHPLLASRAEANEPARVRSRPRVCVKAPACSLFPHKISSGSTARGGVLAAVGGSGGGGGGRSGGAAARARASARARVLAMAPGGEIRLQSSSLEGLSDEGSVVLEKNYQRLRIGLEVRARESRKRRRAGTGAHRRRRAGQGRALAHISKSAV